MIVLRTILYKMVWGSVALLIFSTWTQCSSKSHVREVQATVKDNITITCNYDTYRYKNMKRSWCRQISAIECETIKTGTNRSNYERVYVSQTMDEFGPVNVKIVNLQPWDTGLYNWRVWTGINYHVLQTYLLQVVNGLPRNISVARFKLHEMAELRCDYGLNIKKSKIWYKKIHENKSPWVAHSDGNKGTDYQSRITVNHDEQKKRLTVIFQQLELWDNGIYQCQESGSKTILTEILLIVTVEGDTFARTLTPPMSSSYQQNIKTSSYLLPVNPERKSPSSTDEINQTSDPNTYHSTIFPQSSTLNNSYATLQPWSHRQNKPWNILRWILFLCMLLCVVFFSLYKRSSANISDVRRIYNQPRRSQIYNLSKV